MLLIDNIIYTIRSGHILLEGVSMNYSTIGKNIRKYRTDKNLRQEDLAERANLSVNYVGAVERGEKIPSLETFIHILNALEISSDLVLCDVLKTGYNTKVSLLSEMADSLPPDKKNFFYKVASMVCEECQSENN